MPPEALSWCLVFAVLPLSILITRVMIAVGPGLGLMDLPAERRIHLKPIARSGGLGLFFSLFAGLSALHFFGSGLGSQANGNWIIYLILGSMILVAGGWFDDRGGISAWTKLGIQSAAAVIMFLHNPEGAGLFFGFQIPWIVDLSIHVFWTVALINAFNLIDGMDGLCAGLGSISLTLLAVLSLARGESGEAMVSAVMVMALLGFLCYNFHPAKIFLGDTGSMLVGYFVASVTMMVAGKESIVPSLLLPLLVAGVPLLDVGLAVWRRVARQLSTEAGSQDVRVFGPDRDHLHHRLLGWGFSQRQAALLIYGFSLLLSVLALLPILGGWNMLAVSIVGLVVIGIVGLRYIAPIEFLASGRGLRSIARRPIGGRKALLRYLAYDAAVLFASAMLGWFLVAKALVDQNFSWAKAVAPSAVFTFCVIGALALAKAYTRRWSRSTARDFVGIVVWIACGTAISFTINSASKVDLSFRELVFHLSSFALGSGVVILPRCLGIILQESVIDTMHRKRRMASKRARRTSLIYGAGDLGELFLTHLRLSRSESWEDYHFIGFIDDAETLKGRQMGGFPILGTLSSLPDAASKYGVNHVMVCCSVLGEEKLAQLDDLAESLGLGVETWVPHLSPAVRRETRLSPVPLKSPSTERPGVPSGDFGEEGKPAEA